MNEMYKDGPGRIRETPSKHCDNEQNQNVDLCYKSMGK